MKCDVCHQDNASIFLTQVVEGKVQKVNLCDSCAKEKGVTDPTGFDLAQLLKGMGEEMAQEHSSRGLVCPACGFSEADFKKTGRLGCSSCYETFAEGLEGLLKAMHKGVEHTGKVPEHLMNKKAHVDRIESLQQKLADSIDHENYEEAASIRDELRRLESEAVSSEQEHS